MAGEDEDHVVDAATIKELQRKLDALAKRRHGGKGLTDEEIIALRRILLSEEQAQALFVILGFFLGWKAVGRFGAWAQGVVKWFLWFAGIILALYYIIKGSAPPSLPIIGGHL